MEIIALVVVFVIGAVLMFILQPALFTSASNYLINMGSELDYGSNDQNLTNWVTSQYMPGVSMVFVACALAVGIWLWITYTYNLKDHHREYPWFMKIWAGLSTIPVVFIVLSAAIFQQIQAATLWLFFMYIIDGIWLFWLGTAISTPGNLKSIVPGAYYIRHLSCLK